MQTEKCAKILESSRFRPNPYQLFSQMSELPLSSRCVNEKITNFWRLPDSSIIREQRILMEQVSLCIYYMLIAVSCLHCPHDFSVNHMRTTYAHNNLSAQSDQPIAVCCWNTFTFYKLFLVSSSPHWSRSARCDGVCLNLCLLGIFNRDIWNANSNDSGQTALCNLSRTFAVRSSWTASLKTQLLVYNLYMLMFNIANNAGSKRCLVMKYLDLHCCICFIYRTHRHNICMSFTVLAKPKQ